MDIFHDGDGKPRVLKAVSLSSGSERFAEFAGMTGFDAVWIDLEHTSSNFSNVERTCAYARAGGVLPVVRTCDAQRTHILRALEAGGRVVVVPMVSDKETALKVVEYGRFPPEGKRGYSTMTAGLRYGEWGNKPFQMANEHTYLFAQIETREAVENLDAILSVDGLSGILIGPGDLSTDYGKTAQYDDEEVLSVFESCITRAIGAGKYAAMFATAESLQKLGLKSGACLLIIASDFGSLRKDWTERVEAFGKMENRTLTGS